MWMQLINKLKEYTLNDTNELVTCADIRVYLQLLAMVHNVLTVWRRHQSH